MTTAPQTPRWLHEPLVHFLALGAALFALSAWVGAEADDASRRLVIDGGAVAHLITAFEDAQGRTPSPAELDGLIAARVRAEILATEARALGLDQGDPEVRARLAALMEALAERGARLEPEPGELEAWQAAHPAATEDAWRAAQAAAARDAAYRELAAAWEVVYAAPPVGDAP